jgi:hypothetical protein
MKSFRMRRSLQVLPLVSEIISADSLGDMRFLDEAVGPV